MTTDLVLPDSQILPTIANLIQAGVLDDVSLRITDPNLPFETWQNYGRLFGTIDRASRWWIGDWLNFGDDLYNEEHAQAIETTPSGQEPPAPVEGDEPEVRLTVSERVAAAAKSIWKQAQDDPDPEWVRVPRSALVQLGAALGEKQREG
jgi:hypothetical protein